MQSDRLGRILQLRSYAEQLQDDATKLKLNDFSLSFECCGQCLITTNEHIQRIENEHTDDALGETTDHTKSTPKHTIDNDKNDPENYHEQSSILSIPDTVVTKYICHCLNIPDLMALEKTCVTLAIICRQPAASRQIDFSKVQQRIHHFISNNIKQRKHGSDYNSMNAVLPDLYRFRECQRIKMIFPKSTASLCIFKRFTKHLHGANLKSFTFERLNGSRDHFAIVRSHYPKL